MESMDEAETPQEESAEVLDAAHESELAHHEAHPESAAGFILTSLALEAEEEAAGLAEDGVPELEPEALLAAAGPSWAVSRGGQSFLVAHGVFLAVALVGAAGMIHVVGGNWREGCALLGGSLLLAGAARGMLPARLVGLLTSRGRVFDTVALLLLGSLVILAALVSPPAVVGAEYFPSAP